MANDEETLPGGYSVRDIEAMDRFDAFEAGMNAGKESGNKALKALREIHFYLWPELYPKTEANRHPEWDPYDHGEDAFQWNAGTIENVGLMITNALDGDPETPRMKV